MEIKNQHRILTTRKQIIDNLNKIQETVKNAKRRSDDEKAYGTYGWICQISNELHFLLTILKDEEKNDANKH